jgi:starvation-inducible DNA-binding protein
MTLTTPDDVAIALERTVTDLINLGLAAKQAHWNVVGPGFSNLHLLLDTLADAAREGGDRVAERFVTLGCSPDGRVGTVAASNPLPVLDPGPLRDTDAVHLFGEILEIITTRLYESIGVAASDLVTQGILIGAVERLETIAWMIRAHGVGAPE